MQPDSTGNENPEVQAPSLSQLNSEWKNYLFGSDYGL